MRAFLVVLLTFSLMLLSSACSTNVTAIKTVSVTREPDSSPTPSTSTTASTPETYDDAVSITLANTITVNGAGASVSGNTVNITAGGTYSISGTLTNGMIKVDTTGNVVLILNGANLTNASGPAIHVQNAKEITVVLADETTNHLADGKTYTASEAKGTLFSNDTLVIKGNGALVITGNYQHGISSDDDVIITSGNIIISAATDGIHANNNITVEGATIHITKANDGLESEGVLVINGGDLALAVADDGIVGADTVTVNGGTITITSGVEGIESKNNIIVNDGSITISVSDDGLNATQDVTINGGHIYAAITRGDALDSNGTLNINGGVTIALGAQNPEGGADCDNCAIVITGGVMVATGGTNSVPASTSTQYSVLLGSVPVNSAIRIEQDGAEILTFKVTKPYQNMVFTAPNLAANKTYTVLTGGSIAGGTDFHGLYTGATYTGGSVSVTFTTSAAVTYAGGTAGFGGPGGNRTRPGGRP
jgi:hypothetical protein